MIATRRSGARQRNRQVREIERPGSNRAWLAALGAGVVRPGAVLLLGGSNLIDFRLRVAQSHLRHDLLPSFWSQAGIVVSADTFLSVPLDERLSPVQVPRLNAIHECPLADYDDPRRYPNIAVISFAERSGDVVDHARRLQGQRSAIDLPQLVVAWLAFAWGAGARGNPLMQSEGIPSAALVETAFGIAGIELTPGVASAASCPEAIWQSAIWWHQYYERTADAPVARPPKRSAKRPRDVIAAAVPSGAFVTRQPAAAVIELDGEGTRAPVAKKAPRKRRRPSKRSTRR